MNKLAQRLQGRWRWAGLLLVVLLAHLLVLQGLGSQLMAPSALLDMGPTHVQRKLIPVVVTGSLAPPAPKRRPAARRSAARPPAAPSTAPSSADPSPPPEEPPAGAAPAPAESLATEPAAAGASAAVSLGTGSTADDGPDAASPPPEAQPPTGTDPELWPADTRLSYQLAGTFRGGPVSGDGRVLWQRVGGRYQARIEISLGLLLGHLVMTSQGAVTPEGLHPDVFEEETRSRRRQLILGAQALVLDDGRRLPRPPRTQDTISQFMELAHRLAQGEYTPREGAQFSVTLARPGGLNEWVYEVSGPQTLTTRSWGELQVWQLTPRVPASGSGPAPASAELWLAPALQYLPARIRLRLNDQTGLDMQLEQIEQR